MQYDYQHEEETIFLIQKALSGNYAILILFELSSGTKRFIELLNKLPITQGTLARHLGLLEAYGLVERKEIAPKNVEYSLSRIGEELVPVMNSLAKWGERFIIAYSLHKQQDEDFDDDLDDE